MKIKLVILASLLMVNLSNAQKFSDHINDKNTRISVTDTGIGYNFSLYELKGFNPEWKGVSMSVGVNGIGQQAIKLNDIGAFSISTPFFSKLYHLEFKNISLGDCEKVLIYLKRIKKWFAIAKSEFTPNIALSKSASPPVRGIIPFRFFKQEHFGEKIKADFDCYDESDLEDAIELFEYLTLNSKDIEAHLLKESNRLNEKYKLLK